MAVQPTHLDEEDAKASVSTASSLNSEYAGFINKLKPIQQDLAAAFQGDAGVATQNALNEALAAGNQITKTFTDVTDTAQGAITKLTSASQSAGHTVNAANNATTGSGLKLNYT